MIKKLSLTRLHTRLGAESPRSSPLTKPLPTPHRHTSSTTQQSPTVHKTAKSETTPSSVGKNPSSAKTKTVAQLDEELRLRLEQMSGGQAGVEYENGVAAGLKTEVKRNMFRVINMPR
ncbi:hypothetical protein S40285_01861 [Stachybotrys chlorohalonatus IBT 40285]|uniref:Uncharacterized protein n=1 Tax=Stachybotrys chlorohalonatus (strain IBT 40285) TaxID=1283841 RepID=A0A084QHC6_STAC4|nr:hypothetical protein S40285_01861 [Stachybotrys chlorohalonata IBT 40285]